MWYNSGMRRRRINKNWLIILKYAGLLLLGGSFVWVGVILSREENWVAISALATLILAFIASLSIRETRRIREEDRGLDSKRRRVDDVQNWINEVVKLRAESFIPFDEFDTVEVKRRASELFRILANSRWVKIEAIRLDLEVKGEIKLLDKVNRLLFILENTTPKDLGDLPMQVQVDIEKECTEALEHISAIKTKLLV